MHKWPGPFYAGKPEVSSEVGKVRLTYGEQLDLLKRRGMLIEDEVEAAAILSRVNYYRLSGYRTLRVAGRVTFWLSGAGKSVF